jgi:hypothetical protein
MAAALQAGGLSTPALRRFVQKRQGSSRICISRTSSSCVAREVPFPGGKLTSTSPPPGAALPAFGARIVERFGRSDLRVALQSGRGATRSLGAPYAPLETRRAARDPEVRSTRYLVPDRHLRRVPRLGATACAGFDSPVGAEAADLRIDETVGQPEEIHLGTVPSGSSRESLRDAGIGRSTETA